MPNSRPPKNWPASVSSWANPCTASGVNRSVFDSQIAAQSRQRLNEAIVPGGWIKRAAPWPEPGKYPLNAGARPSLGTGRSIVAPSSVWVHFRLALIDGAFTIASYHDPKSMVRPVSGLFVGENRLGSSFRSRSRSAWPHASVSGPFWSRRAFHAG